MEITLSEFNIDEAIDSHWRNSQSKADTIQHDRQTAETAASNILTKQFRNELDGCLDSVFQSSLNLKVVTPKEISALSVYATFDFMNTVVVVKRNINDWEIAFSSKTIFCSPDLLQKTILLELGKVKNGS